MVSAVAGHHRSMDDFSRCKATFRSTSGSRLVVEVAKATRTYGRLRECKTIAQGVTTTLKLGMQVAKSVSMIAPAILRLEDCYQKRNGSNNTNPREEKPAACTHMCSCIGKK